MFVSYVIKIVMMMMMMMSINGQSTHAPNAFQKIYSGQKTQTAIR